MGLQVRSVYRAYSYLEITLREGILHDSTPLAADPNHRLLPPLRKACRVSEHPRPISAFHFRFAGDKTDADKVS
jgi:hypothetical protein